MDSGSPREGKRRSRIAQEKADGGHRLETQPRGGKTRSKGEGGGERAKEKWARLEKGKEQKRHLIHATGFRGEGGEGERETTTAPDLRLCSRWVGSTERKRQPSMRGGGGEGGGGGQEKIEESSKKGNFNPRQGEQNRRAKVQPFQDRPAPQVRTVYGVHCHSPRGTDRIDIPGILDFYHPCRPLVQSVGL